MDASSKFVDTLPTKPKELLAKFEEMKIRYKKYEHPPIFTVIDAKKYQKKMVGTHVKNLFLRDKKKRNFLLVTEQDAETCGQAQALEAKALNHSR